MPITSHVAQDNIYNVTIDDVSYVRSTLEVSLDEMGETLTVVQGVTDLIPTTSYTDIAADGSPTAFASYADMETWVNAYLKYNISAVKAISTTVVEVKGNPYVRANLDVTLDDMAETLTVVNGLDNLIDNVGYADIYPDDSLAAFPTYVALTSWVAFNMSVIATVEALDLFAVKINGVTLVRSDLTVTPNAEDGTLTVIDEIGTILAATLYSDIYISGETIPFASYAAMAAWVALYMQFNVVTVEAVGVNQVSINGPNHKRTDLTITLDEEAGTLIVVSGVTTLIDAVLYSDIVADGGQEGFASFADMSAWVMSFMRFNGQTIDKADGEGYFLVNGKPMAKDVKFFAWDDEEQALEIRHSHLDYSDKPMPKTRYANIVPDNSTIGFASYQALIDYIAANTFRPLP